MKKVWMRSLGIGFVFTGALYAATIFFELFTGKNTIEACINIFGNGIFLLALGIVLYFVGDKENRQRRMEERERQRLLAEEKARYSKYRWPDKGGAESEWR